MGHTWLERKTALPRGQPDVTELDCVAAKPPSRLQNFNCIPFCALEQIAPLTALAWRLGPTHRRPNTVYAEPLSTSADRGRFSLIATSTKICASARSSPLHSEPLIQADRPSTPFLMKKGSTIGAPLELRPFSGHLHSASKLLHTSYRMTTSMSIFLLSGWRHTFFGN